MSVLHRSLHFTNPDNVMPWAASCLGFFGFLRASEFTVNGPFDPTLHLKTTDIQVDPPTNPQSFRVFIKCSQELFHLIGLWFLPSLSRSFLVELPSSPWARHWTSLCLLGWHSSLKASAIFIPTDHSSVGRCSWKVLRPQFQNWSCDYGCHERCS